MSDHNNRTISRRAALGRIGGAAGAAGAIGIAGTLGGCQVGDTNPHGVAPEWLTYLGKSEQGGRSYAPRVEGTLPAGLEGALYRNGPGLFERDGFRIKHLLDGDGLIQRLAIAGGKAHYRNAFVQTPKYQAEEAAGARLHGTWTTRKSDFFFDSIGGLDGSSQAGVTVYPVHGKLLARDEVGPSFEIDPETLETLGTVPLPPGHDGVGFKAHSKMDPVTGEWIIAGSEFGRVMKIHAAVYEPSLKLKTQIAFESPRMVYIHDFMVTRTHIVFVLHPCEFSPWGFLAGFSSFKDSLTWRGEAGSVVAVVSRFGGAPTYFDAPGSFMWHALNAFDDGTGIITDFVGYDVPDHFIGENAMFETLMAGRLGNAAYPGTLRRYRLDLFAGTLTQEILDTATHEFPMIDERIAMGRHKAGYMATGGLGAVNSGLKRIDLETGQTQVFDFGDMTQVGEPVFAARPGGDLDQGWLLVQCLDGPSKTSYFAVFDAEAVDAGPLARVWLEHHVPISFHGAWSAAA